MLRCLGIIVPLTLPDPKLPARLTEGFLSLEKQNGDVQEQLAAVSYLAAVSEVELLLCALLCSLNGDRLVLIMEL